MGDNIMAAVTILGMAATTYATRVGGLWFLNRRSIGPRTEAWLKALPGTIIISIVAPQIASAGTAEGVASVITALVAWFSKSLLAALIAGIGSAWLLRTFFYLHP